MAIHTILTGICEYFCDIRIHRTDSFYKLSICMICKTMCDIICAIYFNVGIYFVIILYSKLNRGTLGTEHEKFVSIWKLVGFITKLHQCTIIINKSTSSLRMKKR